LCAELLFNSSIKRTCEKYCAQLSQLNFTKNKAPSASATGKHQIFYNTKAGTAGVLTKPIIVVMIPETKKT
jgi:hypothetical protein